MTLPHAFRPPVPLTPVAPAAPGTLLVAVGLLLAVMAVGWWWLRRQAPRRQPPIAGMAASWRELESTLGAPDWYERFGHRLCAVNGWGAGDHDRTAKLLAGLATTAAGRPWSEVARRWEWATYAGHGGSAAEHQADLQLAKARWP